MHQELRRVDATAADRAVLAALRERGGTATRADLVLGTALPEMVVERSLERLLDEYASSVAVAKGGTLLYRFDPRLRRRRERRVVLRVVLGTLARGWRAVVRSARAAFRAVLAVQLLVYMFAVLLPVSVVAGVVVGIGIALAILFSGGSDLDLPDSPEVWAVFLGLCALVGIGIVLKLKYDLLLSLVGARQADPAAGGLAGLIERVNQFAVGRPAARQGSEHLDQTWTVSRADERRVLARIRAHDGRLRAGWLVEWLGLSLEEADQQATRLAVEYGGEPAPVEAAAVEVVEFRFPSLLATADGTQVPATSPGSDEPSLLGSRQGEGKGRAGGTGRADLGKRTGTHPGAPAETGTPGTDRRAAWWARRAAAFRDAARRAKQRHDTGPTRFERDDPPAPLTGNTRRQDGFILLYAGINLTAGLVGHHFLGPHRHDGLGGKLGWLAGGALPIGFSLLLPSLLALRLPFHLLRDWLARRRLSRAATVKAIVAHCRSHGDRPLDLDTLAASLAPPHGAPRPSPQAVRAVSLALGGQFDLDSGADPGKTVWRFRRLAGELAAPDLAQADPAAAAGVHPIGTAELVE